MYIRLSLLYILDYSSKKKIVQRVFVNVQNRVETSQLIGNAGFFFGFSLTEILSQTDMSLLAASLVVFFLTTFSST